MFTGTDGWYSVFIGHSVGTKREATLRHFRGSALLFEIIDISSRVAKVKGRGLVLLSSGSGVRTLCLPTGRYPVVHYHERQKRGNILVE